MGRAKKSGEPTRPQTAYFLFLASKREEIKKDNPDFKVTDVTREAARMWKELPDDEKAPFQEKADEAKAKYKVDLEEYKKNKPDDSDEDSDEAPKRGKKRKATKDPNAPKRPQSAYFLFTAEIRGELKEENPDMKVTEISKECGRRWKELSEEEKAPYQEKADKLKKEYQKAASEYSASKRKKADSDEEEDDDEDEDEE